MNSEAGPLSAEGYKLVQPSLYVQSLPGESLAENEALSII